MSAPTVTAAIVDYGFGNLRSVALACEHVGLRAHITGEREAVRAADAVILPGIGAFGDAMIALQQLDLIAALREVVASGRPLLGVCLGAQLMLSESFEFGHHAGLNLVEGSVKPLPRATPSGERVKVPHVGWTAVAPARDWVGSMLDGVPAGECMYFTHSFYLEPASEAVVLSRSTYGGATFCSSFHRDNMFGCQFHPERSGEAGLRLYRNLKRRSTPFAASHEAAKAIHGE